ncbi:MAG: hypothetical protein NVS1B3_12670 [Candidatus Dormibacteraceae bacterium]
MGAIGLVVALITIGYFLGVWTGGLVFRQRQGSYEDAIPTAQLVIPAKTHPERLSLIDWRSPPELIDTPQPTDDEFHRYNVVAAVPR